mmetsp:Transcript_13325/g.19957  ORF Transcript_13325/g.19957 Transcript_13325/m.19957 type:complete len:87 (-) Transcript_13325:31-291(-)
MIHNKLTTSSNLFRLAEIFKQNMNGAAIFPKLPTSMLKMFYTKNHEITTSETDLKFYYFKTRLSQLRRMTNESSRSDFVMEQTTKY